MTTLKLTQEPVLPLKAGEDAALRNQAARVQGARGGV